MINFNLQDNIPNLTVTDPFLVYNISYLSNEIAKRYFTLTIIIKNLKDFNLQRDVNISIEYPSLHNKQLELIQLYDTAVKELNNLGRDMGQKSDKDLENKIVWLNKFNLLNTFVKPLHDKLVALTLEINYTAEIHSRFK